MAVYTEAFDIRDDNVDSQIETAESNLSASSIEDREVVDEGQNHIRVLWFYTA
jgi:hypothetical protein